MLGLTKKFLISTSVIAGMSAVVGAPAMAANLTGAAMTGQGLIYGYNEETGYTDHEMGATELEALMSPGNVELSGTRANPNAVDMTNATTLTTSFDDGTEYIFSSLTKDVWTGSATKDGYNTFAQQWFFEAWDSEESGFADWTVTEAKNMGIPSFMVTKESAFTMFMQQEGYKRFSDPNIEYVNKDKDGGNLFFDLAGHLDHSSGLKMSEVVMLEYDGGTDIFYAFGDAEASGVHNNDTEKSHSGIYSFQTEVGGGISPEKPERVPEPSTMLGLMAIGGLFAASKRNSQKKA